MTKTRKEGTGGKCPESDLIVAFPTSCVTPNLNQEQKRMLLSALLKFKTN